MDRREFVVSSAALGAAAVLPTAAAAQTSTLSSTRSDPPSAPPDILRLAAFRKETTRQLTTFNLARKSKTIPVPRGRRVTIGEVKGQGYIAQFWLTFPGWFWQHWNPKAPINPSILKTLILRIYWDGAEQPAVAAPVGDFFGAGLCEVASFASRYFGTSSGGFFCKWPMPFRKRFRVELENVDPELDTEVFCNILYQLTDALPEPLAISTPSSTPLKTVARRRCRSPRRMDRATTQDASSACRARSGTILAFSRRRSTFMLTAIGSRRASSALVWRTISFAAGTSAKAPLSVLITVCRSKTP